MSSDAPGQAMLFALLSSAEKLNKEVVVGLSPEGLFRVGLRNVDLESEAPSVESDSKNLIEALAATVAVEEDAARRLRFQSEGFCPSLDLLRMQRKSESRERDGLIC